MAEAEHQRCCKRVDKLHWGWVVYTDCLEKTGTLALPRTRLEQRHKGLKMHITPTGPNLPRRYL